MGKPEDILKRNRERSRQRAQQRARPENDAGMLERIIEGGMLLALWVGLLILAVMVFAFSTFAGMVIFGGFINGLILGVVVTFGAGYVLYKLGAYF